MAFVLFRRWSCYKQMIFRYCATAPQPPLKISLRQRTGLYIKKIRDDYLWAVGETIAYVKQKPIRTASAILTSTILSIFAYKNPSMTEFEAHLATITCDLAEVGESIRNEDKSKELQNLISLHAGHRLRRLTLGVCSLIYVSDFPGYVDLYEAHSPEVKAKWWSLPINVVDVGILSRWLWSEKCMVDFDINPKEWTNEAASVNK